MKAKIVCLIGLALLIACQATPSATPTPTALAPTVTRAAPTARPTRTPLPPTATASATATDIPTVTPTPTRAPSEGFWENLELYPVISASTVGPDGFLYTVYILSHGDCHLYFVRSDGHQTELVQEIDLPAYCDPVAWETQRLDFATYEALHLQGHWSDLNANGLPEITIFQSSGCGGCDLGNFGKYAVYEIQSAMQVTNITGGLRGMILGGSDWFGDSTPAKLLHSADPLTIYVYEPYMYELHGFVEMTWIYEWDGERYQSVSRQYLDEYHQQVDEAVARLKANYGTAGNVEDMLRILLTYNLLDFPRREGLDLFLEVTDPVHWPNGDLCWLQAARAQAILDEEGGRPFRLLPTNIIGADRNSEFRESFDPERFDLSACR